ncbi:MAG TPA: hypothetical protein VMI54_13435 [Polyangiaceae bacterium]|nr:hypothetical protein [Polyangiaceae bacterium]
MAERSLGLAIAAAIIECTLAACGGAPAATAPAATAPARTSATPPPVAASTPVASSAPNPSPSAPDAPGRPCGDLDCLAFDGSRAAFEHALAGSPRVVAVGEAHAQKAVPGVESATVRFARDLLPVLAPRVTRVVLELLAPDRRCEARQTAAVAERTKPVTEPQRDTNQSEFLALGFAAKALHMQVEPLVPTCDELAHVLASDNDVGALLELIANVTARETFDFLDHQKPEHAILIYGGLVHNDLAPAPGHEAWSFGPRVAEHAGGSYVEIDLIVPELVKNEPPWTELAWFSHYAPVPGDARTLLYRTGPHSFVLIFPASGANDKTRAAP